MCPRRTGQYHPDKYQAFSKSYVPPARMHSLYGSYDTIVESDTQVGKHHCEQA